MKTAIMILTLFLVMLDFGLLTACEAMNHRRKDDDTGKCDKPR